MRLPASLEALRERNFARYLAAVTVSGFGNSMALVALAFALLDLGGVTDLGIVLLVREIPIVVFVLLGGVWADRIPRRLILVSCDVLRCASQAATAALLITGHADLWSVSALQMVFGVATAFARPATTGLVQQAVSAAHLQGANALLSLSRSTAGIAGPAAGAVIVAAASPGWALAADAATFGVSALLTASMRLPRIERAVRQTLLVDLRAGWGEFRSRTWVVAMVTSFGIFQLTYFPAFLVLGPAVAKEDLGGAGAWGAILSAAAVGSVVGGVLALRARFRRPLVADAALCLPSGFVLLAIAAELPVPAIAAIAFAASAAITVGDTVWFATLQQKIPEHAISRISSFDWLGSVALNPLGYALIGPLAAVVGVSTTIVIAAAANLVAMTVVLFLPAVRAIEVAPSAGSAAGP